MPRTKTRKSKSLPGATVYPDGTRKIAQAMIAEELGEMRGDAINTLRVALEADHIPSSMFIVKLLQEHEDRQMPIAIDIQPDSIDNVTKISQIALFAVLQGQMTFGQYDNLVKSLKQHVELSGSKDLDDLRQQVADLLEQQAMTINGSAKRAPQNSTPTWGRGHPTANKLPAE